MAGKTSMKNEPLYRPLMERIEFMLREKGHVICAIDGPCASGKTTLGKMLQSEYGGNLFSMDDFFLQPHQRTDKRLAEPGGNVDYERFKKEVLTPLIKRESFSYRPFDCARMEMGQEINISAHPFNIIEGSYSLHPSFTGMYDIKVFLDITPEEQMKRLSQRSPKLLDRFINEWIPLENVYFKAFGIKRMCEIVL
jgi:uridine kinase